MYIEDIIQQELDKLPKWCKEEYGTHEWVNYYGWPATHLGQGKFVIHRMHKDPTYLLPYQVCKHCHLREDI